MTTEIRDWAVVTADIEANGTKTVDRMPTSFLQNLWAFLVLIISWVD